MALSKSSHAKFISICFSSASGLQILIEDVIIYLQFLKLFRTMDFRVSAAAFLLTRKKIDSIYHLCFKFVSRGSPYKKLNL